MERRIFITGFPGFITGHLCRVLLKEDVFLYLLIHPDFMKKAEEERKRIDPDGRKTSLIKGDITQPLLGMKKEEYEKITEEANEIFHLAAIYDLAVGRALAHKVNVVGTFNIIQLALSMKEKKNLRVFNYISTCYVSGKRVGIILEDELIPTYGFKNFYEETKGWAEVLVRAYMDRIPTIIFRPAIVVGDSRTGEINKYDGPYYAIRFYMRFPKIMARILPKFGRPDIPFNSVPVDFVVNAMAYISKQESAIGKTFQLADPNPLSTKEYFELLKEKVTGTRKGWKMPTWLLNLLLKIPKGSKIAGFPRQSAVYLEHYAVYNTKNTDEILKGTNIRCPSPPEYLDRMVEFVRKNPDIPLVI